MVLEVGSCIGGVGEGVGCVPEVDGGNRHWYIVGRGRHSWDREGRSIGWRGNICPRAVSLMDQHRLWVCREGCGTGCNTSRGYRQVGRQGRWGEQGREASKVRTLVPKEWTGGEWGHMGRQRVGIGVRHRGAVSYGRDSVAWAGQRVTAAFKGIHQ